MKAAILEDVAKLVVERIPDPEVPLHHVLLRVGAVGVCGTDMHIFRGEGNYNRDARGRPIPLTVEPHIMGHEFAGEVVEAGRGVSDLAPGDRVLCDQGLNCLSQGKTPLCPYCASGDSHQCQYYQELGITTKGAMVEYISMPAVNCIKLPEEISTEAGALVEPLACITHAGDCVEHSRGRYSFDSPDPGRRIRSALIYGAGPAGLLFLQYLRNVTRFDGLVLVADLRDSNLKLAEQFGGTPVNVSRHNLVDTVKEQTSGERVEYVIEACGSAAAYEEIPYLMRKQGTVLLYGAGHRGRDTSIMDMLYFVEPTLVVAIGASGGFDPDGRPQTYRRALELVTSGKVTTEPFITHRYPALEDIHNAFERDFQRQDYIKGVLNLESAGRAPDRTQ